MVIYHSTSDFTGNSTGTRQSVQIIKLLHKTKKRVIARRSKLHKNRWLIGFYPGIYCRRTFNSRGLYPACFIRGWYNLHAVFSGSQILNKCFSVFIRFNYHVSHLVYNRIALAI
ncbi:hypothetical protein ES703_65894 [subsurface metagenome]